nr:PREDICTED: synaptonemal complex protein 1-like isoform X2 [Lepisosteus oculatus]
MLPDHTPLSPLCCQTARSLRVSLRDSESREQALEESLANAQNALQHVANKLHRPASVFGPTTEERIAQWKILADQIRAIKTNSCSLGLFNMLNHSDLHKRVLQLQSELHIIKSKLDEVIQSRLICSTPVIFSTKPEQEKTQVTIDQDSLGENLKRTSEMIVLSLENSHLLKEKCNLEQSVQDLSSHLKMTEKSRETLESEVSNLQSDLFQARFQQHALEKEKLQTDTELKSSRQVNENILHNLTLLRQKMMSSEKQIAQLESERNISAVRIRALESEREQLIRQKVQLLEQLRMNKSPQSGNWDSKHEINSGAGERETKACCDCERVQRELRHVRAQLGLLKEERRTERPAGTVTATTPPLPTELRREKETSKLLEAFEGLRKITEQLTSLKLKLELFLEQHERRIIESADWGEMIGILKNHREFLSQLASSQFRLKQMVLDAVKSESYPGPPVHLEFQEEDALSLSQSLKQDRAALVLTGSTPALFQDHPLLDCEKWANETNIFLDDHCFQTEDEQLIIKQITALVIELQHLRKACQVLSEDSDKPEDMDAVKWVNRTRLLKNCIDIIKTNETRLTSLRGENRKIQESALREQLVALREEVATLKEAIHSKNKSLTALSLQTTLLQKEHEDLLQVTRVSGGGETVLHAERPAGRSG